jgi:hypothetical protein
MSQVLVTVAALCLLATVWVVEGGQTVVSIQGTQFYINGQLANAGSPAAGLLLNSKMTQVTQEQIEITHIVY